MKVFEYEAADLQGETSSANFHRDGFSWTRGLFLPFTLMADRQWGGLLLWLVLSLCGGSLVLLCGLSVSASVAIGILILLFFGFEGNHFHLLFHKNTSQTNVVLAQSQQEAEIRALVRHLEAQPRISNGSISQRVAASIQPQNSISTVKHDFVGVFPVRNNLP